MWLFSTSQPNLSFGQNFILFSPERSLEGLISFRIDWGDLLSVQFSSVAQSCPTLCDTAHQASLSIINSWSPPKSMSTELVMPSKHLTLCHPLLLLPSIFPSIRVMSSESALHIKWSKYWSFSFNISPSNEHSELIFFRMDWWISLQSKRPSRIFSNTTVQKHQFFDTQLSL